MEHLQFYRSLPRPFRLAKNKMTGRDFYFTHIHNTFVPLFHVRNLATDEKKIAIYNDREWPKQSSRGWPAWQ